MAAAFAAATGLAHVALSGGRCSTGPWPPCCPGRCARAGSRPWFHRALPRATAASAWARPPWPCACWRARKGNLLPVFVIANGNVIGITQKPVTLCPGAVMRRAPALLSSPAAAPPRFRRRPSRCCLRLFAAPGPRHGASWSPLATPTGAPYNQPATCPAGLRGGHRPARPLARSGLEAQFVFLPWLRAVEGAQDGHYDGYLPAYADADSPHRGMVCPSPSPAGPWPCSPGPTPPWTYDGVDDLRGLRVGVVLGYMEHPGHRPHPPGSTCARSPDDLTNLAHPAGRRVDVAVATPTWPPIWLRNWTAKRGTLRLWPLLEKKSLTACFGRGPGRTTRPWSAPSYQGLAAMRADGTLERLLRTHDCAPAHLSHPRAAGCAPAAPRPPGGRRFDPGRRQTRQPPPPGPARRPCNRESSA
jgi:polar amino acid transport system substrate-binding protein